MIAYFEIGNKVRVLACEETYEAHNYIGDIGTISKVVKLTGFNTGAVFYWVSFKSTAKEIAIREEHLELENDK